MFSKHLPHSCVSLNVIRKMQTNLDGIFKFFSDNIMFFSDSIMSFSDSITFFSDSISFFGDSISFFGEIFHVWRLQTLRMEGEFAAQAAREIEILETPEDIQERREQVLGRYANFKDASRTRRDRLEDARLFMYFKRDADELESWINEKLQTASDESYRDPTNLQVTDARRTDYNSTDFRFL